VAKPAARLCAFWVLVAAVAGCSGRDEIELPPLPPEGPSAVPLRFGCTKLDDVACVDNVHMSCVDVGEFLETVEYDCGKRGLVCDLVRKCVTCAAGTQRCKPCPDDDATCDRNVVQRCDEDGDAWEDIEECDLAAGDTCSEGSCENMCELAKGSRSYVGCEFYAADLDNVALDDMNNAAAQQFAVAVTNPHSVPIEVKVRINQAGFGEPVDEKVIDEVKVPPGALEVFKLPQRELDGSSKHGLNDGTNTAVSSNAFRITTTHPIVAYQFNPLENVHVFSNDASLLLPTSAIGRDYTVVSWPETIGDSDDSRFDFDPTSSDDNLRAFLTIIGTEEKTQVHVTLGPSVMEVVAGGPIPHRGPGDPVDIEIGPYDVVNLETAQLNADFTGSVINADKPVTVFVGSEASDVPRFDDYSTRQCCADHLEEQLIPDSTLGSLYIVARTASRTEALAAAQFPDRPLGIAVVNEPEWVRVIAVRPGVTTVTTSLTEPYEPDDVMFTLQQGEDRIIRADQDFVLKADQSVSVLQAMGSQGVTGIPHEYPGGDPSLIVVPPLEQYRRDYIFLTPDKYAFDFVTIMADAETQILFDGEPLPDTCVTSPIEGFTGDEHDQPMRVVHRCQLSFPMVTPTPNSLVLSGDQHDGVHTILADREVGIIVSGFDRFVSYAYVGGLNLEVIN
jgi:hypothetical protein